MVNVSFCPKKQQPNQNTFSFSSSCEKKSFSSNVLHIISEELNDLKIKKDKFYKFKKEWRLNFYVVVFMCLSMPILLKITMPDIYLSFMNSFGSMIMAIIILINLFIINKVEKVYSDLSIGEEGYR